MFFQSGEFEQYMSNLSIIDNHGWRKSANARRPAGAELKQRFPDRSVLSCQELSEGKMIEALTKIGVLPASQTMTVTDVNPI
jgi:hypothetical protein